MSRFIVCRLYCSTFESDEFRLELNKMIKFVIIIYNPQISSLKLIKLAYKTSYLI
ncbi:hypothetical protein A1OE_362 [Candidatus Endolissoclinum faulkneri L2]|uniref:Uncharacterized protein n=1 Tax=Candidatus Endolissoclinum faulkneri L2 TaxID=1193729 RepID=K7YM33_9PROT|nr:hypothetical protein A1OE_362 [Candidatus Endolissoclinum faulkneri L2]